jgi:mannose PTS system EIIA component
MISIIVITHGAFGQELLRTAQDMVGRQEQVAALGVTPEMGSENLGQALEDVLTRLESPEGALILVDMMGGTPCTTALLKTKDRSAEIVTGVNLYMLLSSFTHRARLDRKALAVKVMEDGKKAILLPKDLLLKKMA